MSDTHTVPTRELVDELKRFEKPNRVRAWWQLANTLLPYLGLLTPRFISVRTGKPYGGKPYCFTLLLAVPAGAFPQLELTDPLTIARSVRSVNLNLWESLGRGTREPDELPLNLTKNVLLPRPEAAYDAQLCVLNPAS